jgi:hypothetical protein
MSPKSKEKLCSIIRLLLGEPPINNYRRGTGKPVSLFFCGEGIGLLTDTEALIWLSVAEIARILTK